MAAVSKIEHGVLELHTDVGRLYVCPTGWQRLYLRWTFRNFHSLPREILNARQRRLIEALCRSAVMSPAERVPASAIIGVVENFRVLAMPSVGEETEAANGVQPGQDKLPVLQARAENSVWPETATSAPHLSPETSRPSVGPEIPVDTPASNPQDHDQSAAEHTVRPSRREQNRRLWAIAAVSCAAITVLLLVAYLPQQKQMPHPESATPQAQAPPVAVEQKPAAAPPVVSSQEKLVAGREPEELKVPPGTEGAATNGRRDAKTRAAAPAPKPAEDIADSAPLPEIAEAPRSGFIYPVAPNANLVGKVVLKAVVGSDGTVKQVEVVSGERALAAAAARAVKQWRYAPPEVDGRAVEAQTQVTISFLGDDAISIILPQPK